MPQQHYAAVAKTLLAEPGVTLGAPGKRGFGSGALQVNHKIFAMLSSQGRFVVKLPRVRVDALVANGSGDRFDPGHGRLMKEWFVAGAGADWLQLAHEALRYVAAKAAP
ncbi:MAG: hypothetical protein ACRESS_08555 [Stenotrophobium sp.]